MWVRPVLGSGWRGAALFRGGWVGLGSLSFTPRSDGGTQKGPGGHHCAEGPPRARCGAGGGRSLRPSWALLPALHAGPAPAPASCRPRSLLGGGTAPPGPQPIGVGAPPTLPLPAVWLTTQNHSTLVTERSAVPFLPVNPEYSATRNQVSPARRSDPPSHAWTPPHCFYPPAIPGPAEVGQVQRPGVCHSAHRYPGGSQAPAAGEEPAQPHG